MPAMPPTASAIPGLAAVAAKVLSSGSDMDAASSSSQIGGLDQFAAHFQRLLGKQLAIEVDAGQLPVSPEKTAVGAEPVDELAALLPFIEALGLTQASATAPTTDVPVETAESSSTETAIDTTIDTASFMLAAPASLPTASLPPGAPAISAANPSLQGQTHGLAFNLPAQPVITSETTETPMNTIANGAPAEKPSAGREFSSLLVEAIATNKETQHSPGTTAAAVQNIISQAAPGRTTSQDAAPVISQAVGSPGWTEEVGNHVAWLANRSESKAELVLTPPQMGRIEVSLSVKGDQATANFASANPVVREALEAALPRLREVLADAGIQLGQAQVSAENARQWAQQEKHGDNSASDQNRGNTENAAISRVSSGSLSTGTVLKTGRGFVDVFA